MHEQPENYLQKKKFAQKIFVLYVNQCKGAFGTGYIIIHNLHVIFSCNLFSESTQGCSMDTEDCCYYELYSVEAR